MLISPVVHLRIPALLLLAGVFAAGPAHAQCSPEDANDAVSTIGDAVDAAARHDGFVAAFLAGFASGAHASEADIAAMKTALSHERGDARASAQALFDLVRNDGEIAPCEAAAAGKDLRALSGGSLPPGAARVLSHPAPPANVTAKHYDLSLDLSHDAERYPAKATVTLDQPAPAVSILEADPDRLAVKKVLADGREVPFEAKDGRLFVHAPGARALQFEYDVKPTYVKNGHGLVRDAQTGRMWTMTWPYYGGSLLPSNSAPSDGSTMTITVTPPAGSEAIASGQRIGGSWSSAAETPVYANAIYTAPDFTHWSAGTSEGGVAVSGAGIGHFASAEKRAAYTDVAKKALDFYSGWLGPYDYGDTLKTVELASDGVGGMEHVSAVAIMTSSARDAEYSKQTAAHETAHHWFGDNLRIADWSDFWMSEGFTEYSEYRYFRHADGEKKFQQLLRSSRDEVRSQLADTAHPLHTGPCTDVLTVFDSVPYEQGAWMLRMLEVKMGTPKFDAMLKGWYQSHRHEPVSTAEFVKYASKAAGENLAPWFAEWSNLTAVPKLESNVSVDGHRVTAALTSTNAAPKSLAVPLRLLGANGESKTVMVKPGASVSVDAGFAVTKTEWDPDVTVLADVRAAPRS